MEFAGGETLAELSIDQNSWRSPQAGRVAVSIGVEQMWAQPLGYGVPGDFVEGAWKGAADGKKTPFIQDRAASQGLPVVEAETSSAMASGRRSSCSVPPCDRPPASRFQLADRLFAQAPAGGRQRLLRQDRERLVADSAERRGVVDRLVDIEQEHTADLGRLPLPAGLGPGESRLRLLLGFPFSRFIW